MTTVSWHPTALIPEVGHIWATDDTTECRCRGTQSPRDDRMTGRCLDCVREYGLDVACSFPEVQWLTRPTAPMRHGFWPEELRKPYALPVCRFLPLSSDRLYPHDDVIRCATCVEILRRQPRRLGGAR